MTEIKSLLRRPRFERNRTWRGKKYLLNIPGLLRYLSLTLVFENIEELDSSPTNSSFLGHIYTNAILIHTVKIIKSILLRSGRFLLFK